MFSFSSDRFDINLTGPIEYKFRGLRSLSLLKVDTTFDMLNAMLKGHPSTLIYL